MPQAKLQPVIQINVIESQPEKQAELRLGNKTRSQNARFMEQGGTPLPKVVA